MKQIFSLFSDYFALKDNFLTRMDPRGKLLTAITLILCVIVSTQVVFPLIIFVLCLSAMLLIRIPVGLIVGRSLMPVSIAAVVLLLRAILISGTTIAQFDLVGLTVSVSREGLIEGALAASRILGAVSVIMLLSFVTPAFKIFSSLMWLKVSATWVEIAMMMYRYIFVLLDNVGDMISAQKTRLGYIDTKASLSSMGTLAGAVLLRAFDQAEKTSQAMKARCYNGTMPFVKPSPLTKRQMRVMLTSIAVIVIVFMLIERPGL